MVGSARGRKAGGWLRGMGGLERALVGWNVGLIF